MKKKPRALCCLLAAVTLFGAVGCQKSGDPTETSDTIAETLREGLETYPIDTETGDDRPSEEETDNGDGPAETSPESGAPEEPTPDNLVTVTGEIRYETTSAEQKSGDGVTLSVAAEGQTGQTVTAYLTLTETLEDYNYFVVDWGDGTWSYNGPYQSGQRAELIHVYKQAGTYEVKGCAYNLSAGHRKGWTGTQTVVISGADYVPDNLITKVAPIGSTTAGDEYGIDNIVDGDNATAWRAPTF